jgi:hypothetical protein
MKGERGKRDGDVGGIEVKRSKKRGGKEDEGKEEGSIKI